MHLSIVFRKAEARVLHLSPERERFAYKKLIVPEWGMVGAGRGALRGPWKGMNESDRVRQSERLS